MTDVTEGGTAASDDSDVAVMKLTFTVVDPANKDATLVWRNGYSELGLCWLDAAREYLDVTSRLLEWTEVLQRPVVPLELTVDAERMVSEPEYHLKQEFDPAVRINDDHFEYLLENHLYAVYYEMLKALNLSGEPDPGCKTLQSIIKAK